MYYIVSIVYDYLNVLPVSRSFKEGNKVFIFNSIYARNTWQYLRYYANVGIVNKCLAIITITICSCNINNKRLLIRSLHCIFVPNSIVLVSFTKLIKNSLTIRGNTHHKYLKSLKMLECWKRVEDWRGLCERKQISSTNRHFWNFIQIIGLFVLNFLDANIPMNTSNTNNTIVLSLLHLDPIKRTWHIQAVFSAKVRELSHYIYLIVYLSERWDLTNFTQNVYKHTTLQQIQALIYLRRLWKWNDLGENIGTLGMEHYSP